MISKIKKWIKSAAGVVSIILFAISMILLAAACSDCGNLSDRMSNNMIKASKGLNSFGL